YRDTINQTLSLDECFKAIDECGAPVVTITGGEPSIYKDIDELVEKTLALGKVVYLCTNAQLLHKKIHDWKPHPRFNINVHVDGLAGTHDAITGKEGSFDKAIEGIKFAKKAGFTVCTNTTVYKRTSVEEIEALFETLKDVGVDGMLIAPGFGYEDVDDQSVFMGREEIIEKFKGLKKKIKKYPLWNSPPYLDFLTGKKEYSCLPWGTITYNVRGWKAPCYLITDGHYPTFREYMNNVSRDKYGWEKDKRCNNCMVHSGFETAASLEIMKSPIDLIKTIWWTLF
ncbi:adenosyl-hopene transferase HpnH, partial [bacterium]|nr:adenosyl-hopene transferase HpnH [bacterium]